MSRSHAHDHRHHRGVRGRLHALVVPHSHDGSETVDSALAATGHGIRAVKVSLAALGSTAALQLVIVAISGSVALLADTIHNFSDALTAVPLWIAFVLGRRRATPRYTHGLGRAEDLAGLFIVAMIALSALLAGWEAVGRLLHPEPMRNPGWVLAAALVGFCGNEGVALYRIRSGRRIGSAALVADGVHARTDGLTSLAVVVSVLGAWAGFPLADPLVGLAIAGAILTLLYGTARGIGRRLLDGVDPALVSRATDALAAVAGVEGVDAIRLRWSGHRLCAQVSLAVDGDITVSALDAIARESRARLGDVLPHLGDVVVQAAPRTTVATG